MKSEIKKYETKIWIDYIINTWLGKIRKKKDWEDKNKTQQYRTQINTKR